MAEYDLKTAIPETQFSSVFSLWRPGVTDPGKIYVGDPYIKFEDKNKTYYTRNFNHSELVPAKKLYSYVNQYVSGSSKIFTIPLMEKLEEGKGKIVGYIKGNVETNRDTGHNKLRISGMEISHGEETRYGKTFATGKENQGLKTSIARNILTQVIQKLPFIDEIEGARVSGARKIAQVETGKMMAVIKPSVISRIKNSLAGNGLIEGFFTQSKLSPENVKKWLTKNNRAVAGVAMSGNDPMQSLGIKSMGSATDDPANFYLKMAEGGFIEGDEFSDMIEFVPSAMMHGGGMADINYLTRRL